MRIGSHLGISAGFSTTPTYANKLGYTIFQIFLTVPRKLISRARQEKELLEMKSELEKYDMIMVVHGSYIINLCHPKESIKYQSSLKSLLQDLAAVKILGDRCLGVIIHMGKNIKENGMSDKQAIKNYIIGLKDTLSQSDSCTKIILETGASQGTEVGSEIDGLAKIYHALSKSEKKRVYFCIDTCHIWATGYDISTRAGVKSFFNEFDQKIGISKISCIHFNDSIKSLGSCVDRHADLGFGKIDKRGLRAVARFAQRHQIPIVTETPIYSVDPDTQFEVTRQTEIDLIRKWIS